MKTAMLIVVTIIAPLVAECSDASPANWIADWVAESRVGLELVPGLVRSNAPGLVKTNDFLKLPTVWLVPPGRPPALIPSLKPGVYRAEPHTAIVVVPGPHPDDRCIIGGRGPSPPMKVIQPEVRVVPVEPMKKRKLAVQK